MSEQTEEKDQESNFVKAILKFLRGLFKNKDGTTNPSPNFNVPDFDGNKLLDNAMAKQAIEVKTDTLNLVQEFVQKNRKKLALAIKENRLNDVSEMIKRSLLPNVQTYLDSVEIPDEVMSDPNRRIPEYRQAITDNINAVFDEWLPKSDELRGLIDKSVDANMSEPAMSHNEKLGNSPRKENSREVSKEVEREMTADAPTQPTAP